MDDLLLNVFLGALVIVLVGALCWCTHETYLTYTYGPRYFCDEYEKWQTCDTTIQPVYSIDSNGNATTTFVPRTDCYYRCLRSHKNPKRTDVEE